MSQLTHLDETGRAKMVNVGDKPITKRTATAKGKISMAKDTVQRIRTGSMKKGDVLSVAQVAGITGAKKTWDLIPMCHNIPISGCEMSFEIEEDGVTITATASTIGQTGIEMEALTAVSIAALTVYDMCKAVDKGMKIESIRLVKKTGGVSGDYTLEEMDQ
ncbi:MAG: cyclic pyranopterin monophosphate synthase MoaC [Firmicutes bacterium HGW-Firmicutes-11]|nr:MAG: cyclic pyranopterin monophosphate synthase MoaC [Firmicutes bacterium HGW-Firmicutes-11]